MAFFSFTLLKKHFVYLSTKIEPNKKYYSKDITLSKELNNKNKINSFAELNNEGSFQLTFNIESGDKFYFNDFLLKIPEDYNEADFTKVKKIFNKL